MADKSSSDDDQSGDRASPNQPLPRFGAVDKGQFSHLEKKSPLVSTARTLPTVDDYSQYMDNLLAIQEFANNLESALGNCTVDDEHNLDVELARDFVAFYLEPLRLYQKDINAIRNKVGSPRGNAPEVLIEMLQYIEPQFQSVVQKLDKMQNKIAGLTLSLKEEELQRDTNNLHLSPGLLPEQSKETLTPSPSRTPLAAAPERDVVPPTTPRRLVQQPESADERLTPSSNVTPVVTTPAPDMPLLRPRQKPSPAGSIATAQMGRSLEEWANNVKTMKREGKTRWRLDRHSHLLLQLVSEKYEKAKEYELQRDLEIIFEGEDGVDRGALTREFFHIAFQHTMEPKFKDTQLMVGEVGHVLPEATAEFLVHAYEFIGRMVAHAVYNGCRGIPGLSPALQAYLVYGKTSAYIEELQPPVSIDDVRETDLFEVLSKLEDGMELSIKNKHVLEQWMERSDCRIQYQSHTRQLIIQDLLIYYVFKRRIRQIEALAAGLDTFGLRQFLRENPTKENIAMVFPSPDDLVISPDLFKSVVITRGENYNFQIWEFFERFLDDLAAGSIKDQGIADLVRFLSGSPYLPSRVVVSFSDNDVMPIAHACFNELQLPTNHHSYESFRDSMHDGIAHRDYTLDVEDPAQRRMQDSPDYM